MTIVAPFFSSRARERRAALRAARAARPHAVVGLVVPRPVPAVSAGEFVTPDLLVADRSGLRILSLDGEAVRTTVSWASQSPVEAALLDASTPVIAVGDVQYYGVHGSGTFALSIAQLRRFAARVEAQRP